MRCLLHLPALLAIALAACSRDGAPLPQQSTGPVTTGPALPALDLTTASSPFLQQFAGAPVNWQTWGDQAFALARELDRPMLLFIGYSACPWCAKMRQTSLAEPATAALINDHFVPVLVDSEAHSAVDALFMRYNEATNQHSGWPLIVWLTPDRLPLAANNYLPETTSGSQPGFLAVAERVRDQWRDDPEHYRVQPRRDVGALVEQFLTFEGDTSWRPDVTPIVDVYADLAGSFDPLNGGFGTRPKFPATAKLDLLLELADTHFPAGSFQAEKANQMVGHTLDQLVASALNDHVGGGFFRYSNDSSWNAPNFEKRLDTQAALARTLLVASRQLSNPAYARHARQTLTFVQDALAAPGGGYHAAVAASSTPPSDPAAPQQVGAYYTWTHDGFVATAGEAAARAFNIRRRGNTPTGADPYGSLGGRNLPYLEPGVSIPDMAGALAKLRAARASRPAPLVDRKIVLSWNAQLVSAFATAATILDDPTLLTRGKALATHLLDTFPDPSTGQLAATRFDGRPGPPATSTGYAAVVSALLDLHEADPEGGWLGKATEIQAEMDRLFLEQDKPGYTDLHDRRQLFYNLRPAVDGTRLAANGIAVLNLVRLHALTGDLAYLSRARDTLAARHPTFTAAPATCSTIHRGLNAYLQATAARE